MYDITKLKELASMFHVEVDLWGTEQDRLTMSGKTSDINKFWEAAERQGLLAKDPFDESYNPEDTSWMDDLIDTLRTYPSNNEIENDAFLKELRELYYKHYPNSDKIIKEETLMERMDFDTLYKKVKEQDRPIQESLFGTLLFNTSFANELYDEFYRPLTDLIKKGDKEGALKEWEDLKADFEKDGLDKKKWARTFVEVQKARMEKYKAQIDAMEDNSKVQEPALVESLEEDHLSIEGFDYEIEDTFEDEGIQGYNVVYSKNNTPIAQIEIWDEPSPIMVTNLDTPHLLNGTYTDFESFKKDLIYKASKYLNEDLVKDEHYDSLAVNEPKIYLPTDKAGKLEVSIVAEKQDEDDWDIGVEVLDNGNFCFEIPSSTLADEIGEYRNPRLTVLTYDRAEELCNEIHEYIQDIDQDDIYNTLVNKLKCNKIAVEKYWNDPALTESTRHGMRLALIDQSGSLISRKKELESRALKDGAYYIIFVNTLKEMLNFVDNHSNDEEILIYTDNGINTSIITNKYSNVKIIDVNEMLIEALSSSRSIDIIPYKETDECPYLLGEDSNKVEIIDRYDLSEDELWATGWIGAVQNCNAGPFNSFDELDIYCYDREKGVEYDLPEIPEDIKAKFLTEVNRYITEIGTMKEGYKPHTKRLLKLIGSDKLDEEILESSQSSLPVVTWTVELDGDILGTDYDDQDQAEESFKEYCQENLIDPKEVEYYIYEDFESLDQSELANYLSTVDSFIDTYKYETKYYKAFTGKIEAFLFNNYNFPQYQRSDIEVAAYEIAYKMCEILEQKYDVNSDSKKLDDYQESYTPVSEELDDNPETDTFGKAENVEFVMTCYIPECPGIESVKKVNTTTYQVLYNGTEVEIVFDFSWNEWVYTINGKGPFSHSSYEWLISDIRSITDQESIDESFNDFGDLTDKEAANELGGEMIYCDTCSTKLAFDEYGSYCPKCSQEDSLDDKIEELHESGFDTHSDIDLDMVGTRVANLLDEDNLGDDWIEFDCKDSRGLIGTSDLHMSFEATGSDKVLRGYMRAHTDDTIDVYITNGSEGKFRSPREIARFIAGEFGLFNHNI